MLRTIAVIAACTLLTSAACAQDANLDAMNKDGFSDIAQILQSMTPEQRDAVMKQAQQEQINLQKMSPEQLQALQTQLARTTNTIDMQNIDPDKLNPGKAKSTQGTLNDLSAYQKKYNQGTLNNSAVKYPPADAQ